MQAPAPPPSLAAAGRLQGVRNRCGALAVSSRKLVQLVESMMMAPPESKRTGGFIAASRCSRCWRRFGTKPNLHMALGGGEFPGLMARFRSLAVRAGGCGA